MLDSLDLKIIREFCLLKKNEKSSTWGIMKKIFKEGWDPENNLVKRRLKKMSLLGLFKINGKEKTTYTLLDKNISYKNFNFPDGNKKGIAVFTEDKWIIYELY